MDVTNKIIVYLIGACFLIAYLLAEIIIVWLYFEYNFWVLNNSFDLY